MRRLQKHSLRLRRGIRFRAFRRNGIHAYCCAHCSCVNCSPTTVQTAQQTSLPSRPAQRTEQRLRSRSQALANLKIINHAMKRFGSCCIAQQAQTVILVWRQDHGNAPTIPRQGDRRVSRIGKDSARVLLEQAGGISLHDTDLSLSSTCPPDKESGKHQPHYKGGLGKTCAGSNFTGPRGQRALGWRHEQ